MSRLIPTPWQTIGPYFHYSLPTQGCADLIGQADIGDRADLLISADHRLPRTSRAAAATGEPLTIRGTLFDCDRNPVPDALIEIWQADPEGRYADGSAPGAFIGFGRAATGLDGGFELRTLRPGAVSALTAPHIAISIFGTGLTPRLITRAYFDGDPRNAADPVMRQVPEARRPTLLARPIDGAWLFDIVLSGEGETVFFNLKG